MKVTIELETEQDVTACKRNPLELVERCMRHIPNWPTVVVRVSARANRVLLDANGKPMLSSMVITVTPKTSL